MRNIKKSILFSLTLVLLLTFVGCSRPLDSMMQSQHGQDQSTGASTGNNSSNNGASNVIISMSEAEEIALKHANLAASEVVFEKTKLDYDDARICYEIDFYSNGIEYDYDIDATTGEIIDFSSEKDDDNIAANVSIGRTEAKDIALKHANLEASAVVFEKIELDSDDGNIHYEIEFYSNSIKYDYEISASTGEIIAFSSKKENSRFYTAAGYCTTNSNDHNYDANGYCTTHSNNHNYDANGYCTNHNSNHDDIHDYDANGYCSRHDSNHDDIHDYDANGYCSRHNSNHDDIHDYDANGYCSNHNSNHDDIHNYDANGYCSRHNSNHGNGGNNGHHDGGGRHCGRS